MHHRLEQLLFLFYNFQLSFVSLKTQTALRFGILSTDSFFIDKRLRTPRLCLLSRPSYAVPKSLSIRIIGVTPFCHFAAFLCHQTCRLILQNSGQTARHDT